MVSAHPGQYNAIFPSVPNFVSSYRSSVNRQDRHLSPLWG